MYELKDLKEPLREFTDNSKIINRNFSKELENNPDYATSIILAGIFYEYKRIDANFHSRTFALDNPEILADTKKELIIQEFADFLHQTPKNAEALQKELMKHPELSLVHLIADDGSTLSKEQIEENIKEYFGAIIDVMEDSAKPTLEYIEKYRKAIKDSYFETLAKYGISEPVICRGSPTDIQEGSNISPAVDTENQYTNEIVTGVFATSSYDGVSRYLAKGIMPGGVSMGSGIDIFPQGTFLPSEMQTDPDNLIVAGSSFIYILPADSFEPQIDFSFSKGKCNLSFGGEWVAQGEKGVPFLSKRLLDRIDRDVYENRSVFERKYRFCKREKKS